MRNGQNKRMRGRNRNHKGHHGGGGGSGGGGGHHHNPLTRVYESNGPEVKIRGTAHHIAEKYLQLARDAQASGDPVTAENHFQHAEHYLRMIAVAQEQFRAQNPYYQAPPAPGTITEEGFDGDEEGGQPAQNQPMQGQPMQGQPMQGQPIQNQPPQQGQPNFSNQQNFNAPQPSYPPREQPQPYGGQPPGSNYQGRSQHQPYSPPQPYQPQPAQPPAGIGDAGQLPSFITGTQPQQGAQNAGPNGYDNPNGDGDRFQRHRRRRHRGPGGPRPDHTSAPQDVRGDDGPEPGNN
jgi:hypothetical protein